jgi:hypothetical protein
MTSVEYDYFLGVFFVALYTSLPLMFSDCNESYNEQSQKLCVVGFLFISTIYNKLQMNALGIGVCTMYKLPAR